jgi:beta-galactosidase/beta-glucuronidase
MNMVRIPGGTVYEDERFWDLCDELGIMVWQDCMLGYTDPPEDEAFEAAVVAELEQVFGRLGGRPALAVVCGGQEIEEQAAMFGLSPGEVDLHAHREDHPRFGRPAVARRALRDVQPHRGGPPLPADSR